MCPPSSAIHLICTCVTRATCLIFLVQELSTCSQLVRISLRVMATGCPFVRMASDQELSSFHYPCSIIFSLCGIDMNAMRTLMPTVAKLSRMMGGLSVYLPLFINWISPPWCMWVLCCASAIYVFLCCARCSVLTCVAGYSIYSLSMGAEGYATRFGRIWWSRAWWMKHAW